MGLNILKDNYDRINNFLVFIFIFLLPTQLGKYFFMDFSYLSGVRVDYLAPAIFVTDIIIFLLAIINYKSILNNVKNEKLLFFLGLLALTIPFSLSKEIAIYRYMKIIELLFLFFIFKNLSLRPRMTALPLLIGSCIQLTLALLQFAQKHSIQGVFYWLGERAFTLSTPGIAKASLDGIEFLRPYGTFSHPNSMAGFYVLIYFFVLTFNFPVVANERSERGNPDIFILKYSVLTFSSLLIFITFSKIAIGTYLFLNVIYLFKTKFYKHCVFCFSARLLVLAVVGFIFFQATTDPLTITKRLDLIKNSFEILKQYPITGVGLGNYLVAQSIFPSQYLNFLNQPVHNIFLLFLVETGLLVGGIILWELSRIIRKNVSNQTFLFCLLVVLITGMFDHYWLTLQQNLFLLGAIFGLILNYKIK